MKKASYIMIRPVFIIGLFVSVSGLMWLGLYATVELTEALLIMGSVLAGMALQIAAYIGARRFPKARFWPGLCMLAAGPATLWNAFAGPGALYGVSAEILNPDTWEALPPLYYVAIPPMVAGIGVCIAFVVTGLLSLSADIAGMGDAKDARQKRQALMDMKPAPATGKTQVVARPRRDGKPQDAPDGATRYLPAKGAGQPLKRRGAPPAPGAAAPAAEDTSGAVAASSPGQEGETLPMPESAAATAQAPPTPRWAPVMPSRRTADADNAKAAADAAEAYESSDGSEGPAPEGNAPLQPAAGAAPAVFSPMQRAKERVRSITQTLRLTAIRMRADQPDEPDDSDAATETGAPVAKSSTSAAELAAPSPEAPAGGDTATPDTGAMVSPAEAGPRFEAPAAPLPDDPFAAPPPREASPTEAAPVGADARE